MAYRIENAKTGRSSCRQCGLTIDEGSPRWGSDDGLTTRWFHLACAVEHVPRGFKPYRKKAEAILAATKPAKKKPKTGARRRNEALERAILDAPDDRAAIGVLGDWLQGEGDPWGELIALELSENEQQAGKVLRANQAELTGGFAPKFFQWRDGLIKIAILEAKTPEQMIALMDGVFGLRTAFALERLNLPIRPTPEILAAVARAPRTLRSLFLWGGGKGFGRLAHPTIDLLELRSSPSDAELAELFTAKGLPSIRRFDWITRSGEPVRPSALEELLRSKLFDKLEVLYLHEHALDDDGSELLLDNVERLKRLPALRFYPAKGVEPTLRKALKKPLAGWTQVDDAVWA